jgi:hypothetical protein
MPKPQPESARTEESDRRISMSEDDFRWTLMRHGDFIRELTLFEVERDGLGRTRRRTQTMTTVGAPSWEESKTAGAPDAHRADVTAG